MVLMMYSYKAFIIYMASKTLPGIDEVITGSNLNRLIYRTEVTSYKYLAYRKRFIVGKHMGIYEHIWARSIKLVTTASV